MIRMNQLIKRIVISTPSKRCLHNAHIIKPNTHALEQENQASYLTKTIVNKEAPQNVDFNQESNGELSDMVSGIRNSIIETMFFHRDEPLRFPKRMRERTRKIKLAIYKSEMSSQILFNMLNTLWANPASCHPDLVNTTFSYRPDIMAPWSRNGENIQITGKTGHLVSGRKLLKPFAGEEEIKSSDHQQIVWDDIISPFFDLHQLPTIFEPNSGFHPGAPFPCPQKLLTFNPHYWKPTMHFGQGLFYCFAHTMNHALQNGGKMGADLDRPVPMQYLSFDGTTLYFLWYQLNTLDFENEGSIKNMAWRQELKLFDNVTEIVEKRAEGPTDYNDYVGKRMSLVDFDRKRLTETLENEHTVRVGIYGFNPDAAKRFVDFMLYT